MDGQLPFSILHDHALEKVPNKDEAQEMIKAAISVSDKIREDWHFR